MFGFRRSSTLIETGGAAFPQFENGLPCAQPGDLSMFVFLSGRRLAAAGALGLTLAFASSAHATDVSADIGIGSVYVGRASFFGFDLDSDCAVTVVDCADDPALPAP
jgi:hypothetical protein